jgi:hypothetical protein
MKMKRGQAAMEFLMTYGWAILIMLVVIAVLFYLGIFSPNTNVPKSCTLPAGLSCYEYIISESGTDAVLTLDLGQALGRTINVGAIACSATESEPTPVELTAAIEIDSGHHEYVLGGDSGNDEAACCAAGEPCRARLAIQYNYVGSDVFRTAYGDVSGPIEVVS